MTSVHRVSGSRNATGTHSRSSESPPIGQQSISLSVILPAYNEAEIIEQQVRDVAGIVGRLVADYEIVVTNDGSADATGEILANLQRTAPEIPLRVVTHERNRGYGAALASGFDAASKDVLFFTDGDKQFDIGELAGFLPRLAEAEMVIGWRRKRADPPIRLLNAYGWKLLVNGLFGYTARDVDCAFKLFNRRVWTSLVVHARGATFSAELLVKARRSGFRIVEQPVTHYPREQGSATGAKPAVVVRAFRELFRLWRNLDGEMAADRRRIRQAAMVTDG